MKKIITLFTFFLILNSWAQKIECSDYRIGTFEYSNPKYSNWTVIRTDSTQTEISKKSGVEIYGSIKWKSDCEYVLTYDTVVNSISDDLVGKIINIEITDRQKNKYKCRSVSDDGVVLDFEMIKIE